MKQSSYVYILANQPRDRTYIGLTTNLPERIRQHKESTCFRHTKRYHLMKLVWVEAHENLESAMIREKQLKKWKKDWKYELIETVNPNWETLSDTW